MKTRVCLLLAILAVARSACAGNDSAAVDLFAGWSYLPYPYYWYPDRYCRPGPFWGAGVPLYRAPYAPRSPYFADFYDPYWGYDYSVRYRIWPNGTTLRGPNDETPYVPGAAPTELRSSERKTDWDLDVERFLKTPLTDAQANTNAAPHIPQTN